MMSVAPCGRCGGRRAVDTPTELFCDDCSDESAPAVGAIGAYRAGHLIGPAAPICHLVRAPVGAYLETARFRGPAWRGWEYEALGINVAAPAIPIVPYMWETDERRRLVSLVAVFELMIYPPRPSPLRVQVLWRPDRPPGRGRKIAIHGAGDGPALTSADRKRLWQAPDALEVVSRGGAPKGSRDEAQSRRRRWLDQIRGILKADPNAPDREIGRRLNISPTTVDKVLREAGDR